MADSSYQTPVSRNRFLLVLTHSWGVYGLYLLFTGHVSPPIFLFNYIFGYLGGVGITAGAHRLWAHQSYKAKTPLKILLVIFQAISWQDTVLVWVRDHRVHHKYTETDADPYNAKRGFFFSHMGWLYISKNDKVIAKLKQMDMSDLEADPIVMFQHKYYYPIAFVVAYIIPVLIPCYFWNETLEISFIATNARIILGHHFTFLVNSAAHMWGFRPYDKNIGPVENKWVSLLAVGEGWHNYHHVFPWDYKAAELGNYRLNWSTGFIDFFAWVGWAYDLKTVDHSMIEKRVARTGDGSRKLLNKNDTLQDLNDNQHHHHLKNAPWGWGDKDIPQESIACTKILYTKKDN